jgi:hypothetical protein
MGDNHQGSKRGVLPATFNLGNISLLHSGKRFDVSLGQASFRPGLAKIFSEERLHRFGRTGVERGSSAGPRTVPSRLMLVVAPSFVTIAVGATPSPTAERLACR